MTEINIEDVLRAIEKHDFFFDSRKRTKSLKNLLRSSSVKKKNKERLAITLHKLDEDFIDGRALGSLGRSRGVILTSDGFVVTNYHCVENLDFSNGVNRRVIFDVVEKNKVCAYFYDPKIFVPMPEHDLALVRLLSPKWEGRTTVTLSQRCLSHGQNVEIYARRYSEGRVNGGYATKKNAPYSDAVVTDCLGGPGDSGSPVFSGNGKLVGIVSHSWRDKSMRHKSGYLEGGFLGFRKARYIRRLVEKAIDEIK